MDHDPLNLERQEEQRAREIERQRLEARIEKDDLIWLMQSKRGRRIVMRLLADAGLYRSSFNQNALVMARAEGWKEFGVALFAKLTNYCFELRQMAEKEYADNG